MAKYSLILGYGASGKGAEKFLKKHGRPFLIWDDNPKSGITNPDLDKIGWQNISEIIVSPGINPKHEFLEIPGRDPRAHPTDAGDDRGSIVVRTELDLALEVIKAPIFAITGTNGKSTTTAMIAHGLEHLGYKTLLAGNIGTPLAEHAAVDAKAEAIVLELSSYQLHYMQKHSFRCLVFTNFTPDHEAWHGSSKEYFKAKWRGVEFLEKNGTLVISPEVLRKAKEFGCAVPSGLNIYEISTQNNRLFAEAAIIHGMKKSTESVRAALDTFKGLAHRLEKLGTLKGHPIWNDSKATNFESLDYGLKTLAKEKFILMVGGKLKNEDFRLLTERSAADRACIEKIVVFGESHKKLKDALSKHYPQLEAFPTLASALDSLIPRLQSQPQSLLLSPGGSSFDEFANFAQRGDFFRARITPILDK